MTYIEYLQAAKRHYKNCDYILTKLGDSRESFDIQTRESLIINTYYLGGYIIECLLSYTLLHSMNYNITKSVNDLKNQEFKGLKWNTYFKDHTYICQERKFEKIVTNLSGQAADLELIYNEWKKSNNFIELYEKWNSKLRYSKSHLDFELNIHKIKEFIGLINKMLKQVEKL